MKLKFYLQYVFQTLFIWAVIFNNTAHCPLSKLYSYLEGGPVRGSIVDKYGGR